MKYVTMNNDTAVISVAGRYDLVKTLEVAGELKEVKLDKNYTKVKVDFAKTEFIDSSVERQLIKVRREVGKENFTAVNASGLVLEALRTAKLDSWLAQ